MTPEEIALLGGPQMPFVTMASRASVFADRELRLREKAAGHAMRDYLLLMAELCRTQQEVLNAYPSVPLPDAAALDMAALGGKPPLPALLWPRDPAWRTALRDLLGRLIPRVPAGPAQDTVRQLAAATDARLDTQADRLLAGVMLGLDMAAAPFIAAGLQVYWAHMALQLREEREGGRPDPFGRIDDSTACPCCASRPVASVLRIGADTEGYRYLHCSLCSLQWHMVRIKCSHCQSTKGIHYQAAEKADDAAAGHPGVKKAAVEAETCDECGRYLKIVHMDRDASVEPVADDLASLTLDLLVSEAGYERHGVNFMLLFGDPEAEADATLSTAGSPPDPGGG